MNQPCATCREEIMGQLIIVESEVLGGNAGLCIGWYDEQPIWLYDCLWLTKSNPPLVTNT